MSTPRFLPVLQGSSRAAARMARSTDETFSRLTAALEAAGDVAYAWDLDGDRIEWSGQLTATAVVLTAELATGRGYAARVHPDDLVHRQLMLAAHFDNAEAFDCEYRLRDAEGGFVWLHERGRARRDAAGKPQRMFGVIRAIG